MSPLNTLVPSNTQSAPRLTRHYRNLSLILLLCGAWLFWASHFHSPFDLIQEYGRFIFLGITGAIFANSTGAGGGVIFIPVFSSLNFSESQSVATSFMIQCFGMTAGAISWSLHYKKRHREDAAWSGFVKAALLTAFFSVLGFWSSQLLQLNSPSSLHTSFSIFSIVLGIAIVISSKSSTPITRAIRPVDFLWLALIGYFGGIITAWLSVGVGELVVIYLMLRGLCAKMAVATGVIVSAITVWSASPIHIFSTNSHALFELVLFAGPGAVIGGLLARKLALYLPVKVLKLFFSIWIILTGSVMLAS